MNYTSTYRTNRIKYLQAIEQATFWHFSMMSRMKASYWSHCHQASMVQDARSARDDALKQARKIKEGMIV